MLSLAVRVGSNVRGLLRGVILVGSVFVHKGVFEVFVLCKMEVWRRLKDVKVFRYDQRLVRRMVGVEEVEEEDGLDEELYAE